MERSSPTASPPPLPFPNKRDRFTKRPAFINYHLLRWCQQNKIIFTRSRPYWSDDNCHVEQKNWSIGRRYLGYFRYDTAEALEVMEELEELISLYVNYFQPSVKLKEKIRVGGKVKRIYEETKTPYQRVLESPDVEQEVKRKLVEKYKQLNPAELHRKIEALQERLYSLATPVRRVRLRYKI